MNVWMYVTKNDVFFTFLQHVKVNVNVQKLVVFYSSSCIRFSLPHSDRLITFQKMPQIQTIKPVKLEAIRKGLQEIYNINDISTANLNNLNVNSLGKIFTKILTSETIKGQSITQNSKNCQIFNPNLSPNFYNSLYKASEYVLISKFIVFLLNFFNYSDAEVCLPVCMFYEPNMVMIKKVLTALLKVGRFCQENKNRIGLTEEELKCTMKNQTILNWGILVG